MNIPKFVRSCFTNLARTHFPDLYIKHLRGVGVKVGSGTKFYGLIFIDETDPSLVEIGANCILTDGVKVFTHDNVYMVYYNLHGPIPYVFHPQKTVIKDNVYVGANAVILKNVTVGENSIIGACSIVTHSIPANSVAVGNPCNVIMTIEEYYEKCKREAERKQYTIAKMQLCARVDNVGE